MSYITPFDDLTKVARSLEIPALDLPNNFYPVDTVSDGKETNAKGKGTSTKDRRLDENSFAIKKNGAFSVMHSWKTWRTKKTTVSSKVRRSYPASTNSGHAYSAKTEFYVRNTVGDNIYDEPYVLITQCFSSDGNPINTGALSWDAILEHMAFFVSQGNSEASLDTTQLDRLANGGAAPVGIR